MKWLSLLLVVAAFSATISCLKKQNLEEDDGPSISANEMQQSLSKIWLDDDPQNMQKNEFASVLTVQTLQDVQTRFLGQEGFTILEKTLSADQLDYEFKMAIQSEEYLSNGQTKQSTEEMPFSVTIPAKGNGSTASSASLLEKFHASSTNPAEKIFAARTFYFLLTVCQPRTTIDVTCHNLEVLDGVMTAPDAVVKDQLCKPGTDCKINYKQINFDLVIKDPADPSKKEKYKLQIKISQDVPYLARVMSYCQRGLASISGSQQKVTVNLCQSVNKYQFGTP